MSNSKNGWKLFLNDWGEAMPCLFAFLGALYLFGGAGLLLANLAAMGLCAGLLGFMSFLAWAYPHN